MKSSSQPRLDTRRTKEFAAELRERAKAWIPAWGLADGERDFGRALLEVAARFNSEVAERLDRAGEKMRRGFLDWLAVRGHAARPARMPVVFKLADAAREAVPAIAPVRMQVDAGGGVTVVFETETDVRLLPGRLETVVGVDADEDKFYLNPPGLNDLQPIEPLPEQWQLRSFAALRSKTLQLDPESGLAIGMVIEAAGQQYQITKVDGEIITIDPPLTSELPTATVVTKVKAFAPFDGKARDLQKHALYIGHMDMLDIEAKATIAIAGAQSLPEDVTWQYWGKVDKNDEVDWQTLERAGKEVPSTDAVVLYKEKGAIEPYEFNGKKSRWIRALTKNLRADQQPLALADLRIRINATKGCDADLPCNQDTGESPAAEALANTTPLVLESVPAARTRAAAVRCVLSRKRRGVFETGREDPTLLRDGRLFFRVAGLRARNRFIRVQGFCRCGRRRPAALAEHRYERHAEPLSRPGAAAVTWSRRWSRCGNPDSARCAPELSRGDVGIRDVAGDRGRGRQYGLGLV